MKDYSLHGFYGSPKPGQTLDQVKDLLLSQIEEVKAMAVAECMTNNNKEKCYLYAINDEIVWEGASSSSIIIKDENITEKLASLKKLYDEGTLTKEEFIKAKSILLN